MVKFLGMQLVVLAAGLGSRYGGLKQIEGFGANHATLLEYSVYDALNAHFSEIVFIIREAIKEDFVTHVLARFGTAIPYKLAYQEVSDVAAGYQVSPDRIKPWGTAHAVWCARKQITEPFAVINADDFYGREAFSTLAKHLPRLDAEHPVCMVGYELIRTLSESGSVSRGVCTVERGRLLHIEEHTQIQKTSTAICAVNGSQEQVYLAPQSTVSMNCWGFHPSYLSKIDDEINSYFLGLKQGLSLGTECYLPTVVNHSLNQYPCEVLTSTAQWCGVTYPADKAMVEEQLTQLTIQGVYPSRFPWSV